MLPPFLTLYRNLCLFLTCSQDWESLQIMTNLCHVQIPQDVLCILESIKHNPEAIEEYGIHLAVNTVREIFASRATCGVHFFTLNRYCNISRDDQYFSS